MNVDTNAGCFNPHYFSIISQVVPSCHSHVCVLEIEHAILTLMLAAPPRDQALQATFECVACCRHAVRLWRQMLQSLKEALLSNCPAVVAQDVLGRALLEGVHNINLKYSQLQPSEQWQPRLAADKWYIAETCQLLSQPSDSVYRCNAYQDRTQELHVAAQCHFCLAHICTFDLQCCMHDVQAIHAHHHRHISIHQRHHRSCTHTGLIMHATPTKERLRKLHDVLAHCLLCARSWFHSMLHSCDMLMGSAESAGCLLMW